MYSSPSNRRDATTHFLPCAMLRLRSRLSWLPYRSSVSGLQYLARRDSTHRIKAHPPEAAQHGIFIEKLWGWRGRIFCEEQGNNQSNNVDAKSHTCSGWRTDRVRNGVAEYQCTEEAANMRAISKPANLPDDILCLQLAKAIILTAETVRRHRLTT